VQQKLETAPEGLADAEARRRLAQYRPNRLAPPKRRSALVRLLMQFHNILLYVMLGAAAITAFLDHWLDTSVLLGAVVINAIIGFIQEGRAEEALDSIRSMLSPHATVIRGGIRRQIDAAELVPGDVVALSSGDRVPADVRLLSAREFRIEEAALTGESVPVEKRVEPVAEDVPLGDRYSMAYSGTFVVYGQASGIVVATGESTELGRISTMLAGIESRDTPLLRQINRFGPECRGKTVPDCLIYRVALHPNTGHLRYSHKEKSPCQYCPSDIGCHLADDNCGCSVAASDANRGVFWLRTASYRVLSHPRGDGPVLSHAC
jgi:magnesium-transporting ATPase (P-type)